MPDESSGKATELRQLGLRLLAMADEIDAPKDAGSCLHLDRISFETIGGPKRWTCRTCGHEHEAPSAPGG
jgi:hypothetical protein